jgi:hypothetical protein
LASYDQAIALDPKFIEARWNRSILLLKLGRYQDAWQDHELRASIQPPENAKLIPRLVGSESVVGKSILVYSDMGFGDTIHFCRHLKILRNMGANVIFEAQPSLHELLGSLDGPSKIVGNADPLPTLDFQIPLLSLPCLLQTTLNTIPSDIPYLFASDEKVSYWKRYLANDLNLKVGLIWSGGEKEGWAINYYSHRNIPLRQLSLLAHPNVSLYSLQKGNLAEQELRDLNNSQWQGSQPIDLADQLNNFSDTAALIQNLDLVISVDTAVAHLAGALGKPVWILNRFDGDWRWLLDREDSPWYPTSKIYNQKFSGGWDEVIGRVRMDLHILIGVMQGRTQQTNIKPAITHHSKPFGNAALKVFFDRHGKAERVTLLVSSGDKDRDALCMEFARKSSIPIPRLGTKLAGQLWRQIVINKDAVFTRS